MERESGDGRSRPMGVMAGMALGCGGTAMVGALALVTVAVAELRADVDALAAQRGAAQVGDATLRALDAARERLLAASSGREGERAGCEAPTSEPVVMTYREAVRDQASVPSEAPGSVSAEEWLRAGEG